MRAAIRTGILGYTLSFTHDCDIPNIVKDDHVQLRESSAAINPVDYKVPRALFGRIYGFDVSGTVTKIGNNVSQVKVGDKVFGRTSGSLAEYTVTNENKLIVIPDDCGWSFEECAALPTAYLSSFQALRRGGIIPPHTKEGGENIEKKAVLIIGASGGCGLAAVQLAKAMDVTRIIGICSGKNSKLVTDAGATEVVDYTDPDALSSFWNRESGSIDCVIDTATCSGGGEDYKKQSMSILKSDTSQLCALNGRPMDWLRKGMGMEKDRYSLIIMENNPDDLRAILSLMDKIRARPIVNRQPFTKEGVDEGFKMLKSRRVRGKVVFNIDADDTK